MTGHCLSTTHYKLINYILYKCWVKSKYCNTVDGKKKKRTSLPSFQETDITGLWFYYLLYTHTLHCPNLLFFWIDWDSDILPVQGVLNSNGGIPKSIQGVYNFSWGIQISSRGVFNSAGRIQNIWILLVEFKTSRRISESFQWKIKPPGRISESLLWIFKPPEEYLNPSIGFFYPPGYLNLFSRILSPLDGYLNLFSGIINPLEGYLNPFCGILNPQEGYIESLQWNYKTPERISKSLQWNYKPPGYEYPWIPSVEL